MRRQPHKEPISANQFRESLAILGWQQADFAEKTGLTRQTVNAWAAGRSPPPPWAGAYLGAMLDLAMLRDKYLSTEKVSQGNQSTPKPEA
jgi:transcriptional regulator with XRE-family HTH domain